MLSTLSLDGQPDDGSYNPNMGPSLQDAYDYVMHGRIFKVSHAQSSASGSRIEVSASFGGLLMKLSGEQAQLDALSVDNQYVVRIVLCIVYLLFVAQSILSHEEVAFTYDRQRYFRSRTIFMALHSS